MNASYVVRSEEGNCVNAETGEVGNIKTESQKEDHIKKLLQSN